MQTPSHDVIEPQRTAEHGRLPDTLVVFVLAGQVFGVDVCHVREILDRQKTTRLPNAAADCVGVIDTRGQSIPVIDLCRRFALPTSEPGPDTRIIVFEMTGPEGTRALGTLADRVLGVVPIDPEEIEPAPTAAFEGLHRGAVQGLLRRDGDLVTLICVPRVFADLAPELLAGTAA